jgi:mono/diheme cytochrome c family protein
MKWIQISILAVLVAGPSRQFAADRTKTISEVPIRPIASVNGADLYAQYCAVCHGRDGQGNGPAAAALKPAPADLTQIARRNGGKFPTIAVQHAIAGSDSIVAHGTRRMPEWGELLVPGSDNPAMGDLRIYNLTKYIEGLQK